MNEERNRVNAWHGFALDMIIIVSMTVLTALRIAQITVFIAIVGPLVGARLSGVWHHCRAHRFFRYCMRAARRSTPID